MAVDVAAEYFVAEVVTVRAVAVHDFAQHAVADERGDQHLEPVEAAVFHKHERHARFFPRRHQPITVVYVVGSAHFQRNRLAGFHRGDGNRNVHRPARGNKHRVHFFRREHVAVIARTFRRSSALFLNLFDFALHPVVVEVAHIRYVRPVDCEQRVRKSAAALTEPYYSDSRFFHPFFLFGAYRSYDNYIILRFSCKINRLFLRKT